MQCVIANPDFHNVGQQSGGKAKTITAIKKKKKKTPMAVCPTMELRARVSRLNAASVNINTKRDTQLRKQANYSDIICFLLLCQPR